MNVRDSNVIQSPFRGLGRAVNFVFFFLLCGCAQVVAPTGGPKDVTPPKVVSYSPENKDTGFNAKKIDITFNEYIQLKNLSKQFIISPPLKRMPVPLVKGKVLELSLKKDTLLQNTTYTFNFGNSVCDLNEANPIKNFQYVFSTGSFVDSMSVRGTVADAFTGDPVKDGLVLLYSDTTNLVNDSTPFLKQPSYCGQLDDNGNYEIDNIKEGSYKLIAISPSQGDYFYHPYLQQIGFASDTLSLYQKDTANLFVFIEKKPHLHLNKASAYAKGEVLLIFNKPTDSLQLTPMNLGKDTIHTVTTTLIQYSATSDSAYYWTNFPNLDSLRFYLSRNGTIIDTAVVFAIPGGIPKKSKKKVAPPTLQISTNINPKEPYNYHNPISIQSLSPLAKYDFSKISLKQGKEIVAFTPDTNKLPFAISLKPAKTLISDSSYHLMVLPGAFTDLFGYINDTINLSFKIQEENYFGTLKLSLSFSKKSSYIVQLLDDKNNVYRQNIVDSNAVISYDALLPALYRIRVIKDDNKNGKWDAGNYLQGIEPEKVYYYSDKLNIRSNWDLTQDWKVN